MHEQSTNHISLNKRQAYIMSCKVTHYAGCISTIISCAVVSRRLAHYSVDIICTYICQHLLVRVDLYPKMKDR